MVQKELVLVSKAHCSISSAATSTAFQEPALYSLPASLQLTAFCLFV